MTIFAIGLLATAALVFVAYPLVNPKRYVYYFEELLGGGKQKKLNYLRQKKALVYDNIRDLEQEHAMGKLSPEDYTRLRASLMVEAESVVKEIDEAEVRQDIEELIERDVRSHRKIKTE